MYDEYTARLAAQIKALVRTSNGLDIYSAIIDRRDGELNVGASGPVFALGVQETGTDGFLGITGGYDENGMWTGRYDENGDPISLPTEYKILIYPNWIGDSQG